MLRNRSRAVTSKQALMADHNTTQSSPTQIYCYTRPISAFFLSPRFRAFTSKTSPFESDYALISPTSILDTRPSIFSFNNTNSNNKPFCCHDRTNPKSPRFQSPEAGGGTGLADLVNTVISNNDDSDNSTKPNNKMVLFGSKLRVQIPPLPPNAEHSPKSPADFGTKNRDLRYQGQGHADSGFQTKVLTGCISLTEMELSEDYTCVISHGPNPKTTHIFDNCIFVESYYSSPAPAAADKAKNNDSAQLDNFLSFCYTCKKNLDQKHEIYIYRGEKAFCSSECRYQEMLIDEMEI